MIAGFASCDDPIAVFATDAATDALITWRARRPCYRSGMELRLAVPTDALAVAQIHVRAWQAGYRGLLPDGYLDGLRAEDRAARYTFGSADGPRTTVAITGGAIIGFATIYQAELTALHVDPDAWRQGVGSALIARARADLAAAGITQAHLWLLAGNTRAQQFYERDGWTTDGTRRIDTVWRVEVDELEYRRRL
jgi:GNAT superfamily N-acetyltransferase